ncbi:MAG: bifunctional methylenetetrahydrofolate dehydrogenase/methenyltetrahydrofolate cyclohydrolase FolD [Burkholderiales bacterium]|nr:bifunctional methylenetetrahydrofolate dehydrogenase/methenyltetrahydrofolate cyclohydrolase FolD [Burkholderiales bacterium]
MSKILDGKALSNKILHQIKQDIVGLKQTGKREPSLAVILVGNNPASQIYVNNKKNACLFVGINSVEHRLPETTNETQLLELIHKLNNNNSIDGILVQLPLPKHLNSKLVIDSIKFDKDVDGFHRYNIGSLTLNNPTICPCTPHGVISLLDSVEFSYSGKYAVIIGASNIVGRPMALELLNRGATVTVCNSKTPDVSQFTKIADLIVIAIGSPKYLKKEWVKPGVVVVDVGINRLADNTLCGDADYENLYNLAGYITPVPGGVGPMTIAILIQNTLLCYKHQNK